MVVRSKVSYYPKSKGKYLMGIVIGIDIGGSTTKIIGYDGAKIICPLKVKATDPETSAFGALGKFMSQNRLSLTDISKIMITGVGSSYIGRKIYGVNTSKVDEFLSIGFGGLHLSELDKGIIVSMGTGTAFIKANGDNISHIGGTGVGGGTLLGLSRLTLNIRDFDSIIELAKDGDLSKVDLTIGEISKRNVSDLSMETTASNFGKISELVTKSDIALGIVNMVFQTIGMMAVFACRNDDIKKVILTGNLTIVPQAHKIFEIMSDITQIDFVIPEHAEFATALGAAIADYKNAPSEILF